MDRRRILLIVAVIVAALGASLVFLYAQGAEDRAAGNFETRNVLVVTKPITRGESVEEIANAAKIITKAVPVDQILTGATDDSAPYTGSYALTDLYPGEQLIPAKFGTADQVEGEPILSFPQGDIAIQLALSDTGKVGSFTRPGSHVVVFVTPAAQTSSPQPGAVAVSQARVLLPDLLVLAVGSQTTRPDVTDANGNPLEATPVTNLTVAVSQKEAEILIGVQSGGNTLTFGLRNDTSKIKRDGTIAVDKVNGP